MLQRKRVVVIRRQSAVEVFKEGPEEETHTFNPRGICGGQSGTGTCSCLLRFFLPVIVHQRSTFNRLSSEAGTVGLLAALVAIDSTPPQMKHEICPHKLQLFQ
jgi:hypothetical protein